MYARTASKRHGLPNIFENTGHFTDPSSSDGYPRNQVHFGNDRRVVHGALHSTPEKKKSRGDKSGDLGGQVTGPPRPIHLFGNVGLNAHVHVLHNEMALCLLKPHAAPNSCGDIGKQFWKYIL
ncbi:hypothetical protein TNCV_105971 [Trichonephila clavipes]|nr:hypothetical protein TNCV_105971 [Trichonephila clavipes]